MGNISMENLIAIQQYFKSDIRSMINFLQTNQDTVISINVINDKIWTEWYNTYIYNINLDYNVIILSLNQMSLLYNMDIKNLMKLFIHYLLRINPNIILEKNKLCRLEQVIHTDELKDKLYIMAILSIIKDNNIYK